MRHFGGGQSPKKAQGERDLRLRAERRVAQQEDQTQAIVLQSGTSHVFASLGDAGTAEAGALAGRVGAVATVQIVLDRVLVGRQPLLLQQAQLLGVDAAPADGVERAIAGGLKDPGRRIGRQPSARPAFEGNGVGVLYCFFGEVDVAQDAHQDGHRAPRLAAKELGSRGARLGGRGARLVLRFSRATRRLSGRLSHAREDRTASNWGRTSTVPYCAPGIAAATSSASSSVSHSIR